MYMVVSTADASFFKHTIFLALDLQKLPGWHLDDGDRLRLRGESWLDTLYLRLDPRSCGLHVSIGADSGFPQSPRVQGLLYGRFTELLITHFQTAIHGIQIT